MKQEKLRSCCVCGWVWGGGVGKGGAQEELSLIYSAQDWKATDTSQNLFFYILHNLFSNKYFNWHQSC